MYWIIYYSSNSKEEKLIIFSVRYTSKFLSRNNEKWVYFRPYIIIIYNKGL